MDIVEELHRQADADECAGTLYAHEIGRKAAAEIEALRAERDALNQKLLLVEHQYDVMNCCAMAAAQRGDALYNSNTILLEDLMHMVGQFFMGETMDGPLSHSFMSAEESAMTTLIAAGMAEELGANSCRLLWDELLSRQQARTKHIARSAED